MGYTLRDTTTGAFVRMGSATFMDELHDFLLGVGRETGLVYQLYRTPTLMMSFERREMIAQDLDFLADVPRFEYSREVFLEAAKLLRSAPADSRICLN